MPDLLLEFFSEEIPARMQGKAADDLRKLVTDRLVDAGLTYEGAKAFVTPRRLALWVQGLPARQPDVREEKKGPRVGAPAQAVAGFLKAAGLASIDEAKVQADKKGDFYIAVVEKPGRAAIDVIAGIVPEVVRIFPWPKQMRWGAASAHPGALTWVRPLHSIVATFGPETEDPEIVRFEIGGIVSGDETRGHRFMAPASFKVRRLEDYAAKLEAAKVVIDPARRREIILADAKNLAFAQGFELVEDEGLLTEVAGLVEWPVVLMGSFDAAFLSIPPEVIRTTIRANQKCFVLQGGAPASIPPLKGEGRIAEGNPGWGQHMQPVTPTRPPVAADLPLKGGGMEPAALAPRFILVSNIEASDGGSAIVAGNERVIRARLSDAKFFYETDLKIPLEARLEKLQHIVFHEKLGTQAERVERIARLARELAPIVGADPVDAERAAKLCKADLVTEMVGEFPELQGLMGRYYAAAQNENAEVAQACEDHYKPLGPSDRVPKAPVSIAVALADKIDALVGFWAIDEKPTGSKDPYALRRAALGVIRLVLENGLRVRLEPYLFAWTFEVVRQAIKKVDLDTLAILESDLSSEHANFGAAYAAFRATGPIGSILGFFGYDDSFARSMPLPQDEDAWDQYVQELTGSGSDQSDVDTRQNLTQFKTYLYEVVYIRHKLFSLREKLIDDVTLSSHYKISDVFLDGFSLHRAFTKLLWPDLSKFLIDRLKVQLREQGARHDLVDAVLALGGDAQDDLLLIVRRVEALDNFLRSDDGKNLLAGVKRAANILRIEEKKDGVAYHGKPDPHLYLQKEERELAVAIAAVRENATAAVAREDFAQAMHAVATLRPFVDAFFDKVTVNVEMADRRENRLKLLNQIREATAAVADFSKIEG